ncbi:FecR family protein [Sphingobacterium detergens]|uniref:FecR family protein n=1 Tax=Sphingobacterium detergens TaxID=1145106 RepID=UPI003AAD6517
MEGNNTSRFIPYDLIQKELEEVISAEERLLLERWLSEDLENRKLYDEVSMISSDLIVLEQYKNVDTNSQWERFKHQLDEKTADKEEQKPTAIKTIWKPWTKLVAAAVLLLVGFASYLNFDRWMGYEVRLYGAATQERIVLPDSSVMVLHADAEAVFNKRTFDQQRIVKLKKGKAFFDVKHERTSPFVVDLANNYVRDIGTAFEINLVAKDVEVLVKEGIVALSSGKGPSAKELILQKNEKGFFKHETASLSKLDLSPLDNDDKVAQKLSYSNERLDNICLDLGKRFQSNIVVVGEDLKSRKLSMYFDGQSLNEIVQILSKTLNVKWKASKKGYSIYE